MPKAKDAKPRIIKIKLVRSPIGYKKSQKDTVRALGLRRMHQTVEHQDTAALRGMLAKVIHLIEVEESK